MTVKQEQSVSQLSEEDEALFQLLMKELAATDATPVPPADAAERLTSALIDQLLQGISVLTFPHDDSVSESSHEKKNTRRRSE